MQSSCALPEQDSFYPIIHTRMNGPLTAGKGKGRSVRPTLVVLGSWDSATAKILPLDMTFLAGLLGISHSRRWVTVFLAKSVSLTSKPFRHEPVLVHDSPKSFVIVSFLPLVAKTDMAFPRLWIELLDKS